MNKLSKIKLLEKCEELGIKKCKSKTKDELIELINSSKKDIIVDVKQEINVINGDCLIEMKNIKEKSIDMILCDLPYGMTKNSWDVAIPFDKL